MKIIDEASDQSLLCIGYDFEGDAPLARELARSRFQPGIREKDWWRYHNIHLGLRTLVAYLGSRPVGHIEFMPIDWAPFPVAGENLMFIHCMHVAEHARGAGVGWALLEAAEQHARAISDGVAVMANRSGAFMPAGFFAHCGYRAAERSDTEWLLYKAFRNVPPPQMLPTRPRIHLRGERPRVEFLHCPQCPLSGWALQRLQHSLKARRKAIDLEVIPIGDRAQVEHHGQSRGVFIDGKRIGAFPPNPDLLMQEIESACKDRGLAID